MACCSAPKDDITLSVHTVVVNLADEASLAKKGFSLFVPRPPTAVQWDEVVKWQARHKLPLNKQVKEIRVGDVVFQRQIIHDIRQLVVNIDYLTRGGHRLRRLENDHLIVEGMDGTVVDAGVAGSRAHGTVVLRMRGLVEELQPSISATPNEDVVATESEIVREDEPTAATESPISSPQPQPEAVKMEMNDISAVPNPYLVNGQRWRPPKRTPSKVTIPRDDTFVRRYHTDDKPITRKKPSITPVRSPKTSESPRVRSSNTNPLLRLPRTGSSSPRAQPTPRRKSSTSPQKQQAVIPTFRVSLGLDPEDVKIGEAIHAAATVTLSASLLPEDDSESDRAAELVAVPAGTASPASSPFEELFARIQAERLNPSAKQPQPAPELTDETVRSPTNPLYSTLSQLRSGQPASSLVAQLPTSPGALVPPERAFAVLTDPGPDPVREEQVPAAPTVAKERDSPVSVPSDVDTPEQTAEVRPDSPKMAPVINGNPLAAINASQRHINPLAPPQLKQIAPVPVSTSVAAAQTAVEQLDATLLENDQIISPPPLPSPFPVRMADNSPSSPTQESRRVNPLAALGKSTSKSAPSTCAEPVQDVTEEIATASDEPVVTPQKTQHITREIMRQRLRELQDRGLSSPRSAVTVPSQDGPLPQQTLDPSSPASPVDGMLQLVSHARLVMREQSFSSADATQQRPARQSMPQLASDMTPRTSLPSSPASPGIREALLKRALAQKDICSCTVPQNVDSSVCATCGKQLQTTSEQVRLQRLVGERNATKQKLFASAGVLYPSYI